MKKFSKRTDYQVRFDIVEPGTKVFNFLEESTAITDREHCVVLTGTAGERWPITISQLQKKYDTSAYSEFKLGDTGFVNPRPDGGYIWAEPAESECIVKTSWGIDLKASAGDYIVCADKNGTPDREDRWVINKMIFPNTYKEEEYNVNTEELCKKLAETSKKLSDAANTIAEIKATLLTWEAEKEEK